MFSHDHLVSVLENRIEQGKRVLAFGSFVTKEVM
jgi:hypothetical protein